MDLKGAIIGCGQIAKNAHLPSIRAISGVKIKALVDQERTRARSLSRQFKVDWSGTEYESLLDDKEIDFAIITVPPAFHAQIAVDFMNAGKHVLVEKPLAANLADAKRMSDVASKSGVVAGVVHNRRFYPVVQRSFRSVQSGCLGDIYHADFSSITSGPSIGYPASDWHFDASVSGGGVVMDQGTHTVDLIRWLLGEIESVYGTRADVFDESPTDVAATVLMRTERGIVVTMRLSWINDFTLCPYTLWGSSGVIFAEPMSCYYEETHGPRNPVRQWTESTRALVRFTSAFVLDKGSPTHLFLIRDFIKAIRSNRRPLVDMTDGLRSIEVVDAIYRSISSGRRVDL